MIFKNLIKRICRKKSSMEPSAAQIGADRKMRCPCCGFYTLETSGEYEICPVCYWEDDPLQTKEPEMEGGANTVSLNQARENYKAFKACEERFLDKVRVPLPEETDNEEE